MRIKPRTAAVCTTHTCKFDRILWCFLIRTEKWGEKAKRKVKIEWLKLSTTACCMLFSSVILCCACNNGHTHYEQVFAKIFNNDSCKTYFDKLTLECVYAFFRSEVSDWIFSCKFYIQSSAMAVEKIELRVLGLYSRGLNYYVWCTDISYFVHSC